MTKLYAVLKGRTPGIYNTWSECQQQVNGYSGAIYKSFTSLDECNIYLGLGEIKPSDTSRDVDTIFCDGCFNSVSSPDSWGSVVDCQGVDLIEPNRHLLCDMKLETKILPVGKRTVIICNFTDCRSQQNNGAELLSAVAGLRICMNSEKYKMLCTDSMLILNYWSKYLKACHTGENSKMDKIKMAYILELISLRQNFELNRAGKLKFIPGDNNLADLGYHK